MPNQCTRCGNIYPDASKELLEGCSCGSRFFYYIRQEKFNEIKKSKALIELEKADKNQIEKDIRELTGLDKKPDEPVILDLESVRVIEPGKFEIDLVNLFAKNRPIIYKISEGKYIIDLASSLRTKTDYDVKKPRFLKEYEDEEFDENEDESQEMHSRKELKAEEMFDMNEIENEENIKTINEAAKSSKENSDENKENGEEENEEGDDEEKLLE